ncbi:MAG: type II toxin-antitoxin system VapC family toxin [Proteobacteria bacterium]|nr:type II toxin-antitoxin system VapC family toxin [Pseudomonadota bacterium]
MIAIDTNVLLRYLSWDQKTQAAKADKLIDGSTPVLITDVVLVETLWTLKGEKYELDKAEMIDVLNSLFQEPNIRFEDAQTVWRALNDYRQAKPVRVGNKKKEADFPDALIYFDSLGHRESHPPYQVGGPLV